jgi:hypothetical protein
MITSQNAHRLGVAGRRPARPLGPERMTVVRTLSNGKGNGFSNAIMHNRNSKTPIPPPHGGTPCAYRLNGRPECGRNCGTPSTNTLSPLDFSCDGALDSPTHQAVGRRRGKQMRFLIIAISVFALATGAFAQTTPQSTPSLATGAGLDVMLKEHRDWFTEPNSYKPCPSSVVFPNGQHPCLGCPTRCRAHY